MTELEVETEYWRWKFLEDPPSEEFENEDYDAEVAEHLAAAEAEEAAAGGAPVDADQWEDVVNERVGRDGTISHG